MKRILLMTMLVVFSVATQAQTTKKKAKKAVKKAVATKVEAPKVQIQGAGMLFESDTIDYGTIAHNADGKREFTFINNGTEPLIIETAQGSCGCTVPSKPDGPIAPGSKGAIGVKYDTSRQGPFTKTVTLKSNAKGQETKVLTIKGNVLPPAPAAEPTKS